MSHFPETALAWARLKAAFADYRRARRDYAIQRQATRQAMRDLAADVAMRKASFDTQAYIRNRAAQMRGRV